MAGAYKIGLDYINLKLEFLERLQSHVNAAVADNINEVVCMYIEHVYVCTLSVFMYLFMVLFVCVQ